MTIDETINKLIDLKLHTLAKTLREMLEMPPDKQLSFEDKLGLLVDRASVEAAVDSLVERHLPKLKEKVQLLQRTPGWLCRPQTAASSRGRPA